MREIYLDGNKMGQEVHTYLKAALDLPDYYGSNLDALYDCLTDLGTETKIVITKSELADAAALDVFREAEEDNPFIFLEIYQA